MDTITSQPLDMKGVPFEFSPSEIEICFDRRGKFRLGELRRQQEAKALRVILLHYHGTPTGTREEVYRHVTRARFSLVKARRTHLGLYFMTLVYRHQGITWRHVFRFERSVNGGLSGRLYFNSRRRIATQ